MEWSVQESEAGRESSPPAVLLSMEWTLISTLLLALINLALGHPLVGRPWYWCARVGFSQQHYGLSTVVLNGVLEPADPNFDLLLGKGVVITSDCLD